MNKTILPELSILLAVSVIFAAFNPAPFTASAESNNSTWQLTITGLVNSPENFTIVQLEAMPQTRISAAIYCVDAPTIVVTQGDWQGVKLWTLLNETGISPEATKIAFYATDGYTTDLTVDTVQNNNIILAYAKDGAPLSETLRLVVPGQYGYKWISQVTKIEAVSYDFKGTWESQGYPDDATMTSSNLDNFGTPSPSTPSPTQTPPTASTSASPKETPTTSPTPTIGNSTSQLTTPNSLSTSANVQNLNVIEAAVAVGLIAIVATTLAIRSKKNQSLQKQSSEI